MSESAAPPGARPPPALAVQKCYDLALGLVRRVENFPRSHRSTVGDRLVTAILDVLEELVDAAYASQKSEQLANANLGLHRVRGWIEVT